MVEYSVIFDECNGGCGLVLDLGKRRLGLANKRAEKSVDEFVLAKACREIIPVIIGAGCGEVLEFLDRRYSGPVAVVDKEESILAASNVRDRAYLNLEIEWIADHDFDSVLKRLTAWQIRHGGSLFYPLQHTSYMALERDFYLAIYHRLKESNRSNFWESARYPKFRGQPRPLILKFDYMLERELQSAMEIAGIEHDVLHVPAMAERGQGLVAPLLAKIMSFKPDFLLTVNFLGGDFGGELSSILSGIGLPVATWFMDNPENFFHGRRLPDPGNLVVFCCDPGHSELLARYGLIGSHNLPLAADSARFDLDSEVTGLGGRYGVSFIGSSFNDKIRAALRDLSLDENRLEQARGVASRFLVRGGESAADFIAGEEPGIRDFFESLDHEDKRRYLILVHFMANREYRLSCLSGIMDFEPVIVGDDELMRDLESFGRRITARARIPYYSELLPRFYAGSRLNFACSNVQMRQSVTQRVFDAPAAGAPVVSDDRPQLGALFDVGTEAVAYSSPDEVGDIVARCLAAEPAMLKVVNAARRRIRAEHTYVHRAREICRVMSDYFGAGRAAKRL